MTDNRLTRAFQGQNYMGMALRKRLALNPAPMGATIKGIALFFTLANAGLAVAGGVERGGYPIDRLFEPAKFSFQFSTSYVIPRRKLDHAKDTDPKNGTFTGQTDGVLETENYFTPYLGVKIGLGDHVDCLFDYSQPWGTHTHPGTDWAGVNSNIETKITSDNYGATCSLKFAAGNSGYIRLIGGGFHQKIDGFKVKQVAPQDSSSGNGRGRTELSSDGNGYRLGVAYEIPRIALRTSLVYNSSVSHDISGTTDLSQYQKGLVIPVFGDAKTPQTLELKMQSGIAPDWIAFGSVKWVDWSVLQSIPFCRKTLSGLCTTKLQYPDKVTSLDMLFRDGVTVTGGIGHKINDKLTLGASLTYDRGTQKGFGDQTDTYSIGAALTYSPMKNCALSLGGSFGVLTSGHSGEKIGKDGMPYGSNVSYDFGNDTFSALYASLKVDF